MREKKTTLIICTFFIIFSIWLVYSTAGKTTRCTQSVHGIYHSSYVYQIANGIFPPTSSYSVGMPASSYWGWHMLLAGVMKVFNSTPFESSLIVNTLALITFLTSFWIATGSFVRNPFTRLVFCTVPFIILTPVELAKILFSYLKDINYIPPLTDLFPSVKLFGVAQENRCLFLPKFCNFNGFPTGIALFTFILALVMNPMHNRKVLCALCAVGAFLTAFFHPASGIGVAAIGIAGVSNNLINLLSDPSKNTSQFFKSAIPFFLIFIGLAFALPYMLSLSKALGKGIYLNASLNGIVRNTLYFGWAIFPAVIIYTLCLMRYKKMSDNGKLVLGLGIVLLTFLILLIIRDNTQYQLATLSGIPSALLLLALYQSYFDTRDIKKTYWYYPLLLLLGSLLILGIVNIKVVHSLYRNAAWAKKDPYVYNGQAIDFKVDPTNTALQNRQKTYEWLRMNTPKDAYFLEYPLRGGEIVSSVIAQRRVVSSLPNLYTRGIPHQKALGIASAKVLKKMMECTLTREQLERLFGIEAPWPESIYVVIRKGASPIKNREDTCLSPVAPWVSKTYSNAHYVIYEVQNPHYQKRM